MPPKYQQNHKALAVAKDTVTNTVATSSASKYQSLKRGPHLAKSLLPQMLDTPFKIFDYFFDSSIWEILCKNTNA